MNTLHEGQEVEVWSAAQKDSIAPLGGWRKAKIVIKSTTVLDNVQEYMVAFPDGSRGVFNEEHIRAVDGWNEQVTTCRERKKAKQPWPHRENRDEYNAYMREYNQAWRDANREHIREYNREYKRTWRSLQKHRKV